LEQGAGPCTISARLASPTLCSASRAS
jgi:hypothetical protein